MEIGFFAYYLSGAGPRVRARSVILALAERTDHDITLVTSEEADFGHEAVDIHRVLSPRRLLNPTTPLRVRRALSSCDVVHVPVNVAQLAYVAALGIEPRVAGPGIQHETPYRLLVRQIGVEKMIETHEYVSFLWERDGIDSEYIYPTVDTDLFSPSVDPPPEEFRAEIGVPAHHKMVLFVGALRGRKGAHIVSHLPEHLDAHSQNLSLVVVGDGPHRSEFEARDDLIFEGFVQNEELPPYYAAADVTVVPSVDESFSIVSLESAACGTPVVTTTFEDSIMYRLFYDRGAYVWTERNASAVAETVVELLHDEEWYNKQVQRGFGTIDEMGLSIDAGHEKFLSIYREAAGN